MTTDPDQESLARFCAELPTLRRLLKGPASAARRALVEQAVLAARAGQPIGHFLFSLSDKEEKPDSGGLPEMPPSIGSPRHGMPPRVEDRASGPVSGVYVCPGGTCRRVVTRGAGDELPSCGIHDQALRFIADN